MSLRDTGWGALLVATVIAGGCGEENEDPGYRLGDQGDAPADGGGAKKDQEAEGEAEQGEKAAALPTVDFSESDFVESEESRDPFRSYAHLYVKKNDSEREVQRKIKAAQFSLDELELTGIQSRGRRSVMLTDPNGYGWLLHTGDYVGKPELVSTGGTEGAEVAINWRIDRIRADEVVFIREDAAHPDVPPTTRVMPLYPAADEDS